MSMNGNLARSILCSLVTSVDLGRYSSRLGVWVLFFASCSGVPAYVRVGSRTEMEAAMASGRTVRRNFMKLPQDSPFRTYLRTGGLADFWKSLRNPSCRALLPAERVADWGVCGWATCRGSIGEWTTATLK